MAIIMNNNEKKMEITSEDVEKLEHFYLAGGKLQWFICCGNQFGSS